MNYNIFKFRKLIKSFSVIMPFILIQSQNSIASNSLKESILMIEVMGSANLVSKAKKLGYDVTILTSNTDQRKVSQSNLEKANRHIFVDTNDNEALLSAVNDLKKTVKIDAVIPGNEYFVLQSAFIAKELGLRSISFEAAEKSRNKDYTLLAMQNEGVPTPRFKVVSDADDINNFSDYIEFPAILKPVDSAASDKVFKVNSTEEAREKLLEITSPDDDFEMWGYPLRNVALFEEYVPGQEYSVEGIVSDDVPTFYSITTKSTDGFIEVRHVAGSLENIDLEKRIETYASDTIKALGIKYSPFHMELRLNQDGDPLIMEIGTRISGDYISDIIDLSKDTNFAKDYFRMLTDDKCILEKPTSKRFGAIQFFYDSNIHEISSFEGLNILKQEPWVKEVSAYKKVGDTVPEKPLFLRRLGHVKFIGNNIDEIEERSIKIKEVVKIK